MIASMLAGALLAVQAAPPAPPAPPVPEAGKPGESRHVTVIRTVDKDGKADERREIVIRELGKDAKLGEKREFVIRRGGPDGVRVTSMHCRDGRKFETEAEGGTADKKTKTRIMLCAREGETDASYAQTLKRTADRIAADKNLPDDVRNRVVASLNAEIARLNVSSK